MCDRRNVTDHTDVVIRYDRDVHVAHVELPAELDLRGLGHVDDLPPLASKESALRPGRETGSFNHYDGAAVVCLRTDLG